MSSSAMSPLVLLFILSSFLRLLKLFLKSNSSESTKIGMSFLYENEECCKIDLSAKLGKNILYVVASWHDYQGDTITVVNRIEIMILKNEFRPLVELLSRKWVSSSSWLEEPAMLLVAQRKCVELDIAPSNFNLLLPPGISTSRRLVTNGAFDRFPKLKVVVGHLGEHITFDFWRTSHWIEDVERPLASERGDTMSKKDLLHYFKNNIWVTTTGHFSTPTVSFGWFDGDENALNQALGGSDGYKKVARENAKELFKLTKGPRLRYLSTPSPLERWIRELQGVESSKS
ncbi:2,3-dihydroxybenzoic acid decarboxylase, putative [Metarhizium acridum CQMa 102]|uniref:2,3-dihydroxybenzoic acid decarboxylase, putative n=1 Tax=Metarhizium acridum (strain CQMa 102) TaxID=655827 RepID=E9E3B1_METAQ|nr:2,3-dihydroxybenzoic acid decarboxylase, putative [Metarhizium acridum CQMa 102]EFY89706.1 2,3-dihydroxybenzoic acid decarboxylase, putative [Metarhizium acridum CQMa 102]